MGKLWASPKGLEREKEPKADTSHMEQKNRKMGEWFFTFWLNKVYDKITIFMFSDRISFSWEEKRHKNSYYFIHDARFASSSFKDDCNFAMNRAGVFFKGKETP